MVPSPLPCRKRNRLRRLIFKDICSAQRRRFLQHQRFPQRSFRIPPGSIPQRLLRSCASVVPQQSDDFRQPQLRRRHRPQLRRRHQPQYRLFRQQLRTELLGVSASFGRIPFRLLFRQYLRQELILRQGFILRKLKQLRFLFIRKLQPQQLIFLRKFQPQQLLHFQLFRQPQLLFRIFVPLRRLLLFGRRQPQFLLIRRTQIG